MQSFIYENDGIEWYNAQKADVHNAVFAHIRHLLQHQSFRNADNIRNMRLYNNYDVVTLNTYNQARIDNVSGSTHRVTLNVIQSMIDTACSKLMKNKPRPTFLTDEGNWENQQKAKKLQKYVEGVFYSSNLYKEKEKSLKDAAVFGTGAVKFFIQDNEVKCERVLIDELLTDDVESYYGKPRTIHQTKYIHKELLKALFKGEEYYIDQAINYSPENSFGSYNQASQMVFVVESWHLPSSKNSKDGRHTITISSKTLLDEKYTKDFFPFVFDRWNERPTGFYGQGIAEMLTGLQLEINKILKTIQISMHLISIPKVLIEASSKIVTAHLDNKIGGVIKYAGTPPTFSSLGNIPAELFSHLDRLYQRAYEMVGISQLSAQSQKPAGLNSGKALREYSDIESERFYDVGHRYEETFIEASKIILSLAKDIYEETGAFKVKVKGQAFVESIDWCDVDLDEDKYMMEIFPSSALSKTPTGRLQDVIDLIQAGFISKEDGARLLDFPDLKSVNNLQNSSIEDIERTIDVMMTKGEYQPPEPFQDLSMGMKRIQAAYLLYKSQNAPDENLELLRRWYEDAKALMDSLMQQQAMLQQPPMPTAQPLATPPTPQQSDILPLPTAEQPIPEQQPIEQPIV